MRCPKCDSSKMRYKEGKWECGSSTCDWRDGGVKENFVPGCKSPYVFAIDPEVTKREFVRVHDMSGPEVARASGRGR